MKKLNFLLLGAAGLALASCSNEELVKPGSPDGTAKVSLTLEVPQIKTRAYADGTTAKKLQYAVYDITTNTENYTPLEVYTVDDTDTSDKSVINKNKQIDFQLVNGHKYRFVFWADNVNAPYDVDLKGTNGPVVTVNYKDETDKYQVNANDENLDAFYAMEVIEINGDMTQTIELHRPFAQVNVGTNDYLAAAAVGYTPTHSQITIDKVYSKFDLLKGDVAAGDTETSVTYVYNTVPVVSVDMTKKEVKGETFPVDGYDYLAMTYVLVPKARQTVEVKFEWMKDGETVENDRTVGSVPVQANHRTNIYGQILTSNAALNIIIEPSFDQPDNDFQYIADGVEYDKANETFTISTPAGLAWISDQVNSNGNSNYVKATTPEYAGHLIFTGQTVKLANNIDMTGVDFTPIGYLTNAKGANIYHFGGIFDGNYCTISNLSVDMDKDYSAALFGATFNATIKNLTLTGFEIKGHYKAAALVAHAQSTNIQNCTVKDGTILSTPWEKTSGVWDDANNVGAIAGYFNAQPFFSELTGCTVEGVEVKAFRKIGALVGSVGAAYDTKPEKTGILIKDNTVKNVNLTSDMTEVHYDKFSSREADIHPLYGVISNDGKNFDVYEIANESDQDDNGWTEVNIKKIKGTVVDNPNNIDEVLSKIEDGGVVFINTEEEVKLPQKLPENISFTIMGSGIDKTNLVTQQAYNSAKNSNITLKDLTLKCYPQSGMSMGFEGAKTVEMYGVRTMGEFHIMKENENAIIEDCVFNFRLEALNNNLLWIENGDVTIKNCEFNNEYTPLCVLITYNNAALGNLNKAISKIGDITFENCTFDGRYKDQPYSPIEIHSELLYEAGTLTINGCSLVEPDDYRYGIWREVEVINNTVKRSTKYFTVYVDGELQQEGTEKREKEEI